MISYFFGGYYVMCTLEFINVRLVRYAYKFNQIKVNHTVIYNILTRKNNIRIYYVSFGFPFFIIFTSSIGPIWWESPCKYIFPFLVFGQASITRNWEYSFDLQLTLTVLIKKYFSILHVGMGPTTSVWFIRLWSTLWSLWR